MDRTAFGLMMLLLGGAAFAAPFQNGSFELGGTPCNTFNIPAGNTQITGWTVSVGNIDWLGAPVPACGWQASNGNNSLDLVGSGAGGIGGIQQTFDTIPGITYQVQFDLAGNFGALPIVKPLQVTVAGVTNNYTFDTTGATTTNMGWTTIAFTFVATAASSTIDFVSDVSGAGGTLNAGAALDNVRIAPVGAGATSEIPLDWAHWAAMLLVAMAALAVFARRSARTRR